MKIKPFPSKLLGDTLPSNTDDPKTIATFCLEKDIFWKAMLWQWIHSFAEKEEIKKGRQIIFNLPEDQPYLMGPILKNLKGIFAWDSHYLPQ